MNRGFEHELEQRVQATRQIYDQELNRNRRDMEHQLREYQAQTAAQQRQTSHLLREVFQTSSLFPLFLRKDCKQSDRCLFLKYILTFAILGMFSSNSSSVCPYSFLMFEFSPRKINTIHKLKNLLVLSVIET